MLLKAAETSMPLQTTATATPQSAPLVMARMGLQRLSSMTSTRIMGSTAPMPRLK